MGINQSKDGSDGTPMSESNISNRRTPRADESLPPLTTSSNGATMAVVQPNRVGGSGKTADGRHILDGDLDSLVPTVFKWEHGGREVYITGTFNNWTGKIPMHRSGNDFSYIQNVSREKHAYRFIVDDVMRHAPDQPSVQESDGRISNVIDVHDFSPYVGDENYFDKSRERKIAESEYGQVIPELEEYTKEPPALPPHLRHIILNKPSPNDDPLALPVPQHVALNHLYCTAIKDGLMVLGATQRYKEKFVTIVFYSVMPSSGTA